MKNSDPVKKLAEELWYKAGKEAHFYPVDRYFLEQYLVQIKAVDPVDFISYNLATYPSLYANQLLVCLPELWEKVTIEDILDLIGSLPNIQAFYTLILFTYKYVQVDILQLIFAHPQVDTSIKQQIRDFLKSQFHQLILQEEEQEDFSDDELGIQLTDWIYTRQKLLTYPDVKPTKQDLRDLKTEMERL